MKNDLRVMLRAGSVLLSAAVSTGCGDDVGATVEKAATGASGQRAAAEVAASGASAVSGSVASPARAGAAATGPAVPASGRGGASLPAAVGGSGGGGASGSGAGRTSSAGAAVAASGASGAAAGMSAPTAGSGTAPTTAWPTADIGAAGPFKSMTVMNTGPSNGYMLFFPTELGRDGLKHPIITWGNGAGSTPGGYTLLPRLATHGFVVIASNSSSVTGALMLGGIDWLIAENDRADSMFKGKLDPTQVAAMGYSLGSLGAFDAAADARIKTTVHISGGSMNHSVVANLKNPTAFYCGNDSDIAYANCEIDFEMANVPLIYANFPGGHGGVIGAQAAQISRASVGWLRWRLMGDTTLDAMFVGPDCALCKDSAWDKVQQKDLAVAP